MDCSRAEELLEPYMLGALDSSDRESVEAHLETCNACASRLEGDGDTLAALALAAPQLPVPPAVKQQLFMRIDADLAARRSSSGWFARAAAALGAFGGSLAPRAGMALTSGLVLVVIFSGVWFNGRLNDISEEAEDLSEKVAVADAHDEEMLEEARGQRYAMYEALRMSTAPGSSVSLLSGTDQSPKAHGMILVSSTGAEGVLLVVNLPPLPEGRVYQVWLVSNGRKHGSEIFTVDSTGWGYAVVLPVVPFALVDAVEITIEPSGNGTSPTGSGVLKGDL
jgi:anti-sigma-K factor RskA